MTSAEIRQIFIDFYRSRGHAYVPSAPLAPRDDPSLLFTSAGMVPFKKYYAGTVPLPFRRAVSVQKCLRGTDVDDVGRTPRHNTFFEMLGHFSFGDYFKREAIHWNWELFTDVLGIDRERLTASVYEDDDEAYNIWRHEIGLPPERIVRLGAVHNFWGPAGATGACGPCSELHFDLGPELDPEHPHVRPGDETDRFVEVGNFVFPQFDRQPDGSDRPLKNRGIDTGIGLERLTMVVQGVKTIFHTDLLAPLIDAAVAICGRPYAGNEVSYHIIADHIRALTFALGEGVLPANEGRGYVLRRLIRRAAVRAHGLGVREPFLYRLVTPVVDIMGGVYPEVKQGAERAQLALRQEEERFGTTLEQGLVRFEELTASLAKRRASSIAGRDAFVLYDTYGLPFDLIRELAAGRGLAVDEEAFNAEMSAQKERSRAASGFRFEPGALAWREVSAGSDSEFLGYETTRAEAHVRRLAEIPDNPARIFVVLDRTPFYGEAGGQMGDTGELCAGELRLTIADALREGAEIRHVVVVGDDLEARAHAIARLADASVAWEAVVDHERRAAIRRHHTATHLLHAALRRVLGGHVTQAGSLVAPDRLRFDFTHFSALSEKERDAVERIANEWIVANLAVTTHYSTYEEAVAAGATALFGEKYEAQRVRRVRVGDISEELCAGTHVSATGEIGSLFIIEESAVSSGIRRIEALCGLAALGEAQSMRGALVHVRRLLSAGADELPDKIAALQAEASRLRKDLARARRGEGVSDLDALLAAAEEVAGARLLVGEVRADSVAALRELGDRVRARLGSGGALLWSRIGEKVNFLAIATDDLIESGKLRADVLVSAVAAAARGSGGGKPHMALGGAKDPALLDAALATARERLRAALMGEESVDTR